MKTYSDYGINTKGRTSGEVKTLCPKCSHKRKKKKDPCLNVNIDKGVWNCKNCGWADGIKDDNQDVVDTKPNIRKTPTVSLNATGHKFVNSRGISKATADAFGVKSCVQYFPQTESKEDALAFPFTIEGVEVNVKYRATASKSHSQSAGGQQCLYNYDGVAGAEEIVITEGELDALAVYESGFSMAVCSCPAGAANPSTKNLDNKMAFLDADIIEPVKSIILATDNDDTGIFWRDALIEKLGAHRCKTVIYPDGCKDANDVLANHGKEVLYKCLEDAKTVPVPGIMELCEIRQEIIDYQKGGGLVDGLSTGWSNLDEYFKLTTQTLNILTGIPMSGKSEWLDQLMLNSVKLHDWKWAVYSPENHPVVMHVQKLAEKWTEKPMFNKWTTPAMTDTDLDGAVNALNKNVKVLTFGEKPATVESVITRLKVCKEKWGIKGTIIDPYNELDHCRPSGQSETEYVSEFLSRMRNFGRLYDMAIWIVAHPTKLQKLQQGENEGEYPVPTPYDISGSAHWRNKADCCFSVWRSMKDNNGVVQLHIQKMRNKNIGRMGKVELQWKRENGVFSE